LAKPKEDVFVIVTDSTQKNPWPNKQPNL
jgi:hypothetical protein